MISQRTHSAALLVLALAVTAAHAAAQTFTVLASA